MSDSAPLDYRDAESYHPSSDEKNIALLSHILTLFVGFIAPLVVFLAKRNESEYVRHHAAESLNFQLSIFIYALFCVPLIFVIIGIPLLIGIAMAALVLSILATVRAADGDWYEYPFTIPFIR